VPNFVSCHKIRHKSGRLYHVGEINFSLLQNLQTDSGAQPAAYLMSIGFLSRNQTDRDIKLTTHLHLVPRLRISGAMPLLPLYTFMAWTETLPLLYYFVYLVANTHNIILTCPFHKEFIEFRAPIRKQLSVNETPSLRSISSH
jgi:hypothetical protein